MDAFISNDICNMDETPLALFGDQANKSVNDIGTSNSINGYISNKVRYNAVSIFRRYFTISQP